MSIDRCRSLIVPLLAAGTLFGNAAVAQEEFAPLGLGACFSDIAEHCQGVRKGGGRIMKCLQDKHDLIEASCKAAMFPSDFPDAAQGISITVNVEHLRSKAGVVFVTLSDDPDAFPRGRRTVIAPIAADTATVTFRHLKPGNYAVTAFHDENDSGQFDMLSDGFGASNDVVGMPDFDASAVKVTSDMKLTVSLTYL
jgi:uncharacterized protein (DUF2141 family)